MTRNGGGLTRCSGVQPGAVWCREAGAGVLSEQPCPSRSQTGATLRSFEAGLLPGDSDSHILPLWQPVFTSAGRPRVSSEKLFRVQSCCPALPVALGFRGLPLFPPSQGGQRPFLLPKGRQEALACVPAVPGRQSQPLPSSRKVILGGSDLSPGK